MARLARFWILAVILLVAGALPQAALAVSPASADRPPVQPTDAAPSHSKLPRDPASLLPDGRGAVPALATASNGPMDAAGESPMTAAERPARQASDLATSPRPTPPAPVPNSATWTIAGSVHFSDGTVPHGAFVTLKLDATNSWNFPIDNSTGAYSASGADASYKIGVLLKGDAKGYWYAGPSMAPAPVSSLGATVTVNGASLSGLDLTIPASRHVTGTVHWGAAAAASGTVKLYDLYGNQAASVAVASGTFSALVRPGKYLISATSTSGTFGSAWYASTGYAISSAKATVVTVSTADVTGLTISLPPMQRVSGHVQSGGGVAIANVFVEAWVDGVYWDRAITDASGNYSIAIPPGTLEVWFYDLAIAYASGWWAGGTSLTADSRNDHTIAVTSGSGTVTASASMTLAHYISGRLSNPDMGAGEHVHAMLAGSSVSSGTTDTSGAYSIPVLPGSYTVYEPGGASGATGSVQLGKGWYGSGGFVLDASGASSIAVANDVTGIDMTIPQAVNLFGHVRNEDGLGLNAYVQIFHNGALYDAVYTSVAADGSYHVSLPAGTTYTLEYAGPANLYGSGWYATSGLVRTQAQATAVGVGGPFDVVLPILSVPGKPTNVVAAGFSGSAVVTWRAPANDGGSTITKYTVTSTPGSKTCTTTGALRCILSGLTNSLSYTFRVTATNDIGTSAASDPSAAAIPTPVPGPPVNVLATPSNSNALVSWAAPSVIGGSAISRYTVTSSPGGKTCMSAVLSCRVSGLTNGTSYTFTVTATNGSGTGPASLPSVSIKPIPSGTFHAVTPTRILDTRYATGLSSKFKANVARGFHVGGAGGVPVGAVAVTGNLTVANPSSGYAVYLGPVSTNAPTTSTLNFGAGQAISNGVTVAIDGAGLLYATYMAPSGSTTDLVFDVTGYFLPNLTGATYHPINPYRILDSRGGAGPTGRISANTPLEFPVRGLGDVGDRAIAVTGNVTSVNPSEGWAIYVGPNKVAHPTTSTVNFVAGQAISNNLTVAITSRGTLWATFISNGGQTTDLVFDVTGYYTAEPTGTSFMPVTPSRLLDTRTGNGHSGALSAGSPISFGVIGRGGVPAGAVGVSGNVTVVNETYGWAAYVGPLATPPSTSTINFVYGDVRANGATVALNSTGGLYAAYLSSGGNKTDLLFDVTGYFVP